MYHNLASQKSLLKCIAFTSPCSVKNTDSSFFRDSTLSRTLPHDNHRTSECRRIMGSADISLHSSENSQHFFACGQIALTIFTTSCNNSSSSFFWSLQQVFSLLAASASRCTQQCKKVQFWDYSLMRAVAPLSLMFPPSWLQHRL